jgi:cysteine desulfurase / selenocysteine lyase
MSSGPSKPEPISSPSQDALSEDGLAHHAPAWPDPNEIERLANAYFQMTPFQTAPSHSAPSQSAPTPISPGIPVVPPSPTEVPAPSIVTSVAPFAPAKPPVGPPDLPPTTIPSYVPTPNISASGPPMISQPAVAPYGLSDIPQPGASVGAVGPAALPTDIDYSAIPRLLGDSTTLASPRPAATPYIGYDPATVPGGEAPAHADNLYFLHDRTPIHARPTPSASAPLTQSLLLVDRVPPTTASSANAPERSGRHPPHELPETFAIPNPSEADPHRFSDGASLATPPAPAPVPTGLQNGVVPGGVGPASSDALYFVRHAGGHAPPAEASHTAPAGATPNQEPQHFEPQLLANTGSAAQPFDPYEIKRDFPILQQQVHGKPLIWLDNAATTQKPQAVIDRLAHFYEYENSNVHRAAHALAARATDAYETAREKVRRFLKAPSVKEIIFVRGTTEAINLVAQSWGRRNVKSGDEIVISWLEHHANIVPWQQLCAETGAKLCVAPVDDRGQIILEEYERLLNPRTRVVSVSQVSNALGTVTPVREMTAMAHRHGARVLIDGAQSAPHMAVDVQSIDCDFFVFSGHKVFGPTGIGVLYGKQDVLEHMPPWQGGGSMIADVTFEKTVYQGPPERFEAGTGNIADAVGLGAALDYIDSIGMEVIGRYEHDLLVYATEKMLLVPGLKFIGTATEKASVLSFVLDDARPEDVGKALDREGIAVRAGHHCAQPILRRFGLEATVRPSLAFYNTCTDIDALVAALLRIQSGKGRRI